MSDTLCLCDVWACFMRQETITGSWCCTYCRKQWEFIQGQWQLIDKES